MPNSGDYPSGHSSEVGGGIFSYNIPSFKNTHQMHYNNNLLTDVQQSCVDNIKMP